MASTRYKETKDGRGFYEIRCRPSRDKGELSTRWYVPDGWSKRAIERELKKQVADFEQRIEAGEVKTRKEIKAEQEQAAMEAAKILTVEQYGERVFMPAKTVTCSENTRSSFQGLLNLHVYPVIGKEKMPEVTTSQLSALLLNFQKTHAHASAVKLYVVLNLLFKMAYLSDAIERNPMDKVERPKARKDEKLNTEVEAFTVDELRYIFDCLEGEPLKWRALVRLMVDTGIRRGECCGLTWENVDFRNSQITIAQSLNYTKDAGVYISTPKSGKRRVIDVGPDVMDLLRQLRREQADTAISKYVFTQDGTADAMFPQSPERYMQMFGKRYGVHHMHPHKLRHSFASIAITSGADVVSVSEILGHADTAVTLRTYAHANEESKKRASNIFREALKQA